MKSQAHRFLMPLFVSCVFFLSRAIRILCRNCFSDSCMKIVTTLLNHRQAPSSADSRGCPIGIRCYAPGQVVISFLLFHELRKNVEALSETSLQATKKQQLRSVFQGPPRHLSRGSSFSPNYQAPHSFSSVSWLMSSSEMNVDRSGVSSNILSKNDSTSCRLMRSSYFPSL
jgi:hypothetical protein